MKLWDLPNALDISISALDIFILNIFYHILHCVIINNEVVPCIVNYCTIIFLPSHHSFKLLVIDHMRLWGYASSIDIPDQSYTACMCWVLP